VLEVDVPRGRNLNALFTALSANGMDILSLRNRANRLEELFVSLVQRTLPVAGTAGQEDAA